MDPARAASVCASNNAARRTSVFMKPSLAQAGGLSILRSQRGTGVASQNSSHFPEALYHPAMPSFDIVSQVNSMEIENAVNTAKKELANRFDFKGSKAEIVLDKSEIKLAAEDQFRMKGLNEIV